LRGGSGSDIIFFNSDITAGDRVAQLVVRRLDDDVKKRLKALAKKHGRSLEAEARAILEEAANHKRLPKRPRKEEIGFGDLMHAVFKDVGLTKEEKTQFDEGIRQLWSHNPPRFVDFKK
jgi:plasmid stability protein